MSTRYHLGCSGFSYADWKGLVYPPELPQRQWLQHYATLFDSVEINNSFYRMPTTELVRGWYDKTPAAFKFVLKGSRYVTHLKKLLEPQEHVARFHAMADELEEKPACVLWQLPRNMPVDLERLRAFCAVLEPRHRNVIEFRHNSWWEEPEVRAILHEHGVAFCGISAPSGLSEELVETTDFAYIRFHGASAWYRYDYSRRELQHWARRIRKLKAKEVFIYFNNDFEANAVHNGLYLRDLLERQPRRKT